MKYSDTLASYMPSIIVGHLVSAAELEPPPTRQEFATTVMFADISGFTSLSEEMMKEGRDGVEGVAKYLNAYFGQMVRIIASEGGDVFKFAGDAMIVVWTPPNLHEEFKLPESKDSVRASSSSTRLIAPMEQRVRSATQCAYAIQEQLHDCKLADNVTLCVKIGIGVGEVAVLHLGGVHERVEYVLVGEPLLQAFRAEDRARAGDIVLSDKAWLMARYFFSIERELEGGFVTLDKRADYAPMRKQSKIRMLQHGLDDPMLRSKLAGYIPGAVLRNLLSDSPEEEYWSNEIRYVSSVFANLGLEDHHLLAAARYNEAVSEVQMTMLAVQESVYEYEGSINKFLLDDKGSTLVAIFGLPPVAHEDDPARAVLSSLRLCERLFDLGLSPSVGITTGKAFCGVVGSKTRREYTVLGDSINLAARLMQRSLAEQGGIMADFSTKRSCRGLLQFIPKGDYKVKGKEIVVRVFQPYPVDFTRPAPPHHMGPNMFRDIHQQQLQNYAAHKVLTGLQAFFARPRRDKGSNTGSSSGYVSPGSRLSCMSHQRESDQRRRCRGSKMPVDALANMGSSILDEEKNRSSDSDAEIMPYQDIAAPANNYPPLDWLDVAHTCKLIQYFGTHTGGDDDPLSSSLSQRIRSTIWKPRRASSSSNLGMQSRSRDSLSASAPAAPPIQEAASLAVTEVAREGYLKKAFGSKKSGWEGSETISASHGSRFTERGMEVPPGFTPAGSGNPSPPVPSLASASSVANGGGGAAAASSSQVSFQPPQSLTLRRSVSLSALSAGPVSQSLSTATSRDSLAASIRCKPFSLRIALSPGGSAPLPYADPRPGLLPHLQARTLKFLSRTTLPPAQNCNVLHYQLRDPSWRGMSCVVSVPRALDLASLNLETPQICVRLAGIIDETMHGLLLEIVNLAEESGLLQQDDLSQSPAEKFCLHIQGTRAFLPIEAPSAQYADPDVPNLSLLPLCVKEACGAVHAGSRLAGQAQPLATYGVVELVLIQRVCTINIRSHLLQSRMELLTSKLDLVVGGVGKVIVLEAGPGAGKTELLSSFSAKTLPHTARIHVTSGSPFSYSKTLGAWGAIIKQHLDILVAQDFSTSEYDETFSPRDRMLLRELAQAPDLVPSAYLVNDVLGTSVLGPDLERREIPSLAPARAAELRRCILLQLLRGMAMSAPRIVILDDAHYLDNESWALALDVSKASLPILLILSMRSMVMYKGLFTPLPPSMVELRDQGLALFIKIGPLPPEETESLILSILGGSVASVGPQMVQLVENLCFGNPLLIKELVSFLKMTIPPMLVYTHAPASDYTGDVHREVPRRRRRSGTKAQSLSVRKNFHVELASSGGGRDIECPHLIAAQLVSTVDRLNSCQVVLLKCASLLGRDFSYDLLREIFPVAAYASRLKDELDSLEHLGIIMQIPGSLANPILLPGKESEVYRFTNGFMPMVMKSMMLQSQQSLLMSMTNLRVKRHVSEQHLKNILNRGIAPSRDMVMQGPMRILKSKPAGRHITSGSSGGVDRTRLLDWKTRWGRLTGECLRLFRNEADSSPSQVLHLADAMVTCRKEALPVTGDRSPVSELWLVCVTSKRWAYGGTSFITSQRAVLLAFESSNDANEWFYMIQTMIRVIDCRRQGLTEVGKYISDADSATGTESDKSAGVEFDDADFRLCVQLLEAVGLVLPHIVATPAPYYVLDLDGHTQQSRLFCGDVNSSEYSWSELSHVFAVSSDQRELSSLQVQIWSRNVLLSNDLLGSISIPLPDLHEGPDGSSNAMWYELGKPGYGKLLISCRLVESHNSLQRRALRIASLADGSAEAFVSISGTGNDTG
jgi:class 3 adenylate cyclase